jgi:hypothetical protein
MLVNFTTRQEILCFFYGVGSKIIVIGANPGRAGRAIALPKFGKGRAR